MLDGTKKAKPLISQGPMSPRRIAISELRGGHPRVDLSPMPRQSGYRTIMRGLQVRSQPVQPPHQRPTSE